MEEVVTQAACKHSYRDMVCTKCGLRCDGKADAGKLQWHLLPWEPLAEVVKVMMFGANKYRAFSWHQVPNPQERYWNAAHRHLMRRYRGELDEETGLNPLAHLICDALFILTFDKILGITPIGPSAEEMIKETLERNKE